ncbi:MAG: ATP-binding protein [Flavobacteriaceae bacterium]
MPFARSLAARLAAVASIWSVCVLLVAGYGLSRNYENRAERQFAGLADVYLLNLIAGLETDDSGNPASISVVGEPRFEAAGTGYYWQVTGPGGNRLLSLSLGGAPLSVPSASQTPYGSDFRRTFRLSDERADGGDDRLLAVERLVVLGEDNKTYDFLVALPLSALSEDISGFRRNLLIFLAVIAAGLVGTTMLVVHFGLRPLAHLRGELESVIAGDKERISGVFPTEIAPVSDEINHLIERNQAVVDRARAHVGNLAHALKTPLSVIVNETAGRRGKMAAAVAEQTAAIRRVVDYHLERARMVAIAATPGLAVEVEPVIAGIVRTMQRIHSGRGLEFEVAIPAGLRFRGDARDLEEMTGNLIDNACKWAGSRVAVTGRLERAGANGQIRLAIEDDGPGLSENSRKAAVKRGQRLDESTPGSGLGLSIVTDLADAYGGKLRLDRSALGGLKSVLKLPGGRRDPKA